MIYRRVTDILSPFSGLSKVDPEILKRAAQRGTFIHNVFDAKHADMGYPEIPDAWQGYIDSVDKWMSGKAFLNKPPRWFCEKYAITGECDGIYQDGNDLVLFDLKTPASEGKTWFLQGSAYAYLARKAGYDIKRIEFIRLKKTGQAPCIYVYEDNFDSFLSCLKVYEIFFKDVSQTNDLDYV